MTRREQIIRAIVATLTAANPGAPVQRSRTAPITDTDAPVIVVEAARDLAVQTTVPKLDWTLALKITLSWRGGALDSDADPVVQAIHAAVMADQTQGGLAMDTLPTSIRWGFSNSDAGACDIECNFAITYRTSQSDLTSA